MKLSIIKIIIVILFFISCGDERPPFETKCSLAHIDYGENLYETIWRCGQYGLLKSYDYDVFTQADIEKTLILKWNYENIHIVGIK